MLLEGDAVWNRRAGYFQKSVDEEDREAYIDALGGDERSREMDAGGDES